jgi:hypothetical protein
VLDDLCGPCTVCHSTLECPRAQTINVPVTHEGHCSNRNGVVNFAVGGSVAAESCCIFDSHLLPAQLYLTDRETVK